MAETTNSTGTLTPEQVERWLVDKMAYKLDVEPAKVDVDMYFDEFDLDSTEALVLSGELEKWLGFELEATALWYHPTISDLSRHIAQEYGGGNAGMSRWSGSCWPAAVPAAGSCSCTPARCR